MVDSYSKWIDCKLINSNNSETIIKILEDFIAIFGYPDLIVTDNGPPFNSIKFKEFCEKSKIKILNSIPYNPESNGIAERGVQTIKLMLKRMFLEKGSNFDKRINDILFIYRNTPTTTNKKSPNQLILSFDSKTKLDYLKPPINHTNYINRINEKIKTFEIGENVLYLNHFKDYIKWIKAKILNKFGNCIYEIELVDQCSFTKIRRIVHINRLKKIQNSSFYRVIVNKKNENEIVKERHKITRQVKPISRLSYFKKGENK